MSNVRANESQPPADLASLWQLIPAFTVAPAARVSTGQDLADRGGNPAAPTGAALRCVSMGCVSVLAGECRDHLPGALKDALMQFALDDRPQDRFLAISVGRVGHLAW